MASAVQRLSPTVTYEEIGVITNNWQDRIATGGFATIFKGKWSGKTVAVKRLDCSKLKNKYSVDNIQKICKSLMNTEILILGKCNHKNIIQLLAFCIADDVPPCLVYEYMNYPCLADAIWGSKKFSLLPLTWLQRYNIAKDIAKGLDYLHNGCKVPIIHRDIKPANILLNDEFEVKIGDFGLAIEGVKDTVTTKQRRGTIEYLPSEYLQKGELSTKIDVYSYGLVLYVLATGQLTNVKERKPNHLLAFIQTYDMNRRMDLMDKALFSSSNGGRNTNEKIFEFLMSLAGKCCCITPDHRLSMHEVVNIFQETSSCETHNNRL